MIDKAKYQHMNKKELNNELLQACQEGHSDIVQYLLTSPELKEHADIHHKSNSDSNALLYACARGYLDIVKYLLTSPELKEHANIHDQDNYGKNSLIRACQEGHSDIVQYLLTSPELKEHADIHHKSNSGSNALMIACHYGHLDIAQYLIIDMNMVINEDTMSWLLGKNKYKIVYNDALKIIESRNMYQKLNNSIKSNKQKNTGIKI